MAILMEILGVPLLAIQVVGEERAQRWDQNIEPVVKRVKSWLDRRIAGLAPPGLGPKGSRVVGWVLVLGGLGVTAWFSFVVISLSRHLVFWVKAFAYAGFITALSDHGALFFLGLVAMSLLAILGLVVVIVFIVVVTVPLGLAVLGYVVLLSIMRALRTAHRFLIWKERVKLGNLFLMAGMFLTLGGLTIQFFLND
jgi:hypothetical protein